MHLLFGCLFTLLFGFLIFIFVIGFNLLKIFFRVKQTTRKFTQSGKQNNTHAQNNTHTYQQTKKNSTTNKKIFQQNEGEYVDFEEVK